MLPHVEFETATSEYGAAVAEHPPHILCVDDDPELQTTFEIQMSKFHATTERAFFGMHGIVKARASQPDLILLDLAIPNGNGEYLLNCIKGDPATAAIPVIVLTGMRDPAMKRRMLSAGAAEFLHKPKPFDELVNAMRRFIPLMKRDDS